MFINNAWYVAAWDTEVTPDALFTRRILGNDVVFYRGDDGAAVALENRCCHRLAPLSHGQREGNCVRCMYHGLVFDASGRCVEVPGQERIGTHLKVRSFPLVERDRLLWIWTGDPALADPALIHDAHWHDTPEWTSGDTGRGGYIHYRSDAQLIADNLLDFSHLAFVHNKSIGTRKQAGVTPTMELLADHGVRITYITPTGPTAPFARKLSRLPEATDRFQVYTWHVQGCYFAQDSVIAAPGEGMDTPNPDAMRLHTMIALTPESDTSTHYFWSIAHNAFNPDVPDITTRLVAQVGSAFDEDRQIIEAQQRVIDESPGRPMMPIRADIALTEVRRMVDRLVAAEAALADVGAVSVPGAGSHDPASIGSGAATSAVAGGSVIHVMRDATAARQPRREPRDAR